MCYASDVPESLYKLHCSEHQNNQYFYLSEIVSLEVSETEYCANWKPNIGKYRDITVSFKNGITINMIVHEDKLQNLVEAMEPDS